MATRSGWWCSSAWSRWRSQGGPELDGGGEEAAAFADRLRSCSRSRWVGCSSRCRACGGARRRSWRMAGVSVSRVGVERFDLGWRRRGIRRRRSGWRCGRRRASCAGCDGRAASAIASRRIPRLMAWVARVWRSWCGWTCAEPGAARRRGRAIRATLVPVERTAVRRCSSQLRCGGDRRASRRAARRVGDAAGRSGRCGACRPGPAATARR